MASKTTMTLSEAEHGGRVNAGYVNDDTLYEIELTDKVSHGPCLYFSMRQSFLNTSLNLTIPF